MQEIIIENEPAVISVASPISQPKADQAKDVAIADAGGYYTGTNVEVALQEVGATDAQQTSDIATNTSDITALEARGLQEVTEQGATTDQDVAINARLNNTEYLSAYFAIPINSGGYTWDLADGQCAKLLLTGNLVLDLFTDNVGARTIILEVKQDSVGGHLLTFYTGGGASTPDFGEVNTDNVNTDANSITHYVFILSSDGKYRGNGYTFSS